MHGPTFVVFDAHKISVPRTAVSGGVGHDRRVARRLIEAAGHRQELNPEP
jgi:hypothetical protein